MKVLDSESIESMYASMESILGLTRATLESVFDSIDLEAIYGASPSPGIPANEYLLSEIVKRTSLESLSFDCIHWFHLTRTVDDNDFKDGILPLGQCIDSIWDFLYALLDGKLSKQEWDDFRANQITSKKNHYSYLYCLKTCDSTHWGPYALLIRDTAFKPDELHNHDYFRVPEIVEDICIVLQERHGVDLLPVFAEKTRPCIVKFVDDNAKSYCLEAALYHLYHVRKGGWCAPVSPCSTGFDGKGKKFQRTGFSKLSFLIIRELYPAWKRSRRRLCSCHKIVKLVVSA